MNEFCTATKSRWEILKLAGDKKIVLFGTGKKARDFFAFHAGDLPLVAVVDNDIKKHDHQLEEVIPELKNKINGQLVIRPVSFLQELGENVFILVANAKPEPLIKQLQSMGLSHILTFKEWQLLQSNMHLNQDINRKKVIFFMYMHGAHEKEITKQLLRYRPDLDIVWVVSSLRKDAPSSVRMVLADDMYDCRYEATSAGVWVTGLEILDEYFQKRMGQYYIQVKHWSSLTLKVFGPECNRNVVSEEEYGNIVKTYELNNEKMDVVFSGSDFDEESCRRGWSYEGPFIRVGSPRTDIMFNSDSAQKVYAYIGMDKNVQLAMYAPTFRWPHGQENPLHDLALGELYNSLKKRFDGEWKILLRLHPLVAEQAREMTLPDYVINVSDYDDSEELAAAADVTITDFSSIMFEPAFVYKPVFLYAPDKDEYQREHPLLLDYDKLPFPVCVNNMELSKAIMEYDENEYKKKLNTLFDRYNVHEDGHASERAAMYILGLLDAKE